MLDTAVDYRSRSYREVRSAALAALEQLEIAHDAAREGGGERAATRHHARGKLLARERIELLVDRDSPLLELSPVAGWEPAHHAADRAGRRRTAPVGAAVVTALGTVEGRACVIAADDPTQPATTGTLRKLGRALAVALENRLPLVCLADRAGSDGPGDQPGAGTASADLEPGADVERFHRSGQVAAGFARLAAAGVPTVHICFGAAAAEGGPYDHTVALRPGADHLAEDEQDALRLARQCARQLPPPPPRPTVPAVPPEYDPEDLLGLPAGDPWEILSRVLDGSALDEVQPEQGSGLCAGWGRVHGYPVAVLADGSAAAPEEAAAKAAHLVRLAARARIPLLCLQQGQAHPGLAATVAAAGVPLVTVRVGSWRGVPGVAALARFRFAWPEATAGLGLGVPAPAPGTGAAGAAETGAGAGTGTGAGVAGTGTGGQDLAALALSGCLDDDGVIDPRDTRTVVGMCLSVIQP